MAGRSSAKPPNPFGYFNSSPEVIRLVLTMYVRFPLSLRNVEDLLFKRGIDLCHETVRLQAVLVDAKVKKDHVVNGTEGLLSATGAITAMTAMLAMPVSSRLRD